MDGSPPPYNTPSSPFDETIDAPNELVASQGAVAQPSPSPESTDRPAMALVEGSGPQLSRETEALLQCRLRIAAMALCLGFGVFAVYHTFRVTWTESTELLVYGVHLLTLAILASCAMALCRPGHQYSAAMLRVKEVVIFGMPAFFFLLMHYFYMQHSLHSHKPLPDPSPSWMMLIFTYAMFIPNTWRRAAWPISLMAVAPVASTYLLWCDSCMMTEADNTALMSKVTLGMIISGGVALIGIHTINTLRRQAFRAKELGQYRLRHQIGSGGMGEVYLAEHQLMKRPCAIKLIRPEKAGDPRVLARFEREVRTTAKLSHWNNIDVFDYGRTEDGTFYYVMEFLPGLNLFDLVHQYGPLPPERVIYLLRQTCDALSEAHNIGLIHRDIKPANIFAAKRGGKFDVAKLLDFGLAKPLTEATSVHLTQEGTITGSPLYMSPEQASGDEEPDGRSDIYALGAVAYFLLTGQPPFDGDRPMKVLAALMSKPPEPPSALRPGIPEDLERVVMRCLEKELDDRFPTAESLGKALAMCDSAGDWDDLRAAAWWNSVEIVKESPQPVGV